MMNGQFLTKLLLSLATDATSKAVTLAGRQLLCLPRRAALLCELAALIVPVFGRIAVVIGLHTSAYALPVFRRAGVSLHGRSVFLCTQSDRTAPRAGVSQIGIAGLNIERSTTKATRLDLSGTATGKRTKTGLATCPIDRKRLAACFTDVVDLAAKTCDPARAGTETIAVPRFLSYRLHRLVTPFTDFCYHGSIIP